jgi:hypothetical protein
MGVRRWTDDLLAELRRLVEVEGYSADMAAKALGETRNAVIGACSRHDIKLTPRPLKVGDHLKLRLLDHPKIAARVKALFDEVRTA